MYYAILIKFAGAARMQGAEGVLWCGTLSEVRVMAIAKKSRHSERLRLDRGFFIYLNQATKNIPGR